jgi:hypothetical protein
MIKHWLHPYLVVMRPSNGSGVRTQGSIVTNPFSGSFALPPSCSPDKSNPIHGCHYGQEHPRESPRAIASAGLSLVGLEDRTENMARFAARRLAAREAHR